MLALLDSFWRSVEFVLGFVWICFDHLYWVSFFGLGAPRRLEPRPPNQPPPHSLLLPPTSTQQLLSYIISILSFSSLLFISLPPLIFALFFSLSLLFFFCNWGPERSYHCGGVP